MFTGFNIKMDETAILDDLYYEKGLELLQKDKAIIDKNLEDYVCESQFMEGSLIQNDWFPQIDADFFISHNDERMVISMVGWLYELFGLKAFIDSSIWGFANDILKIIDDRFCKNDGNSSYCYEKRTTQQAMYI